MAASVPPQENPLSAALLLRPFSRGMWVAWLLLALSLAFTLVSWRHVANNEDQQAAQRLEFIALDMRDAIRNRMAAHEQILRGTAALFAASISLGRNEWQSYVEYLHVEQRFPGIQSIGFAQLVSARERDAHTRTFRAEGFPDYAIRPEGERPEYTPVVYIEPLSSRNRGMLGHDHFSEPVRRAAMEHARDTGEAALSAKVMLPQGTIQDTQTGYLLYLPIYRNGAPHATVAQRRAALVGYVYASFRMKALMNGILGPRKSFVDLEIHDGTVRSPDALLYDDGWHASSPPRFVHDTALELSGRTWTLRLSSTPAFEAQAGTAHSQMILLGGLVISVMIFLTVASLVTLRQSEIRANNILQSALDAIVIIDRNGRIVEFNPSAVRVFGYSRSQALGKKLAELIIPAALREQHRQGLARYLETGESQVLGRQIEMRALRSDGSEFPVELTVVHVTGIDPPLFAGFTRDITERKRAEQALSESNALTRTIFEAVQDGVLVADSKTRRFQMGNAAMCRMLGYSLDEFLNLGIEDIHPEADIPNVTREFERITKGGIGLSKNLPVKRKDGTVFYADINTGPMIVNGVACLVGVFRDITERKRAEERLQLTQFSVDQSSMAILWVSPAGRVLHANGAACSLFGRTEQELLAMNAFDISPTFPPEAWPGHWEEQKRRGTLTWEDTYFASDGRTLTVEISANYLHFGDREYSVAFIHDISTRKHQEKELRESGERLQAILDNVVQMFFIADGSLHVEYASPRCLEIYGYSSDEMIARPTLWMETIHPEDRNAMAGKVHSGASAINEYRIIRKDGSVRWVRSVSNPVMGTDGKLQRVYGTVMDITEFETLRSSLKEKEVLLKEIHHRVKNNLQIVISLMRLQSRAFSEERVRAALKDLETRIRAMALVHEHLYHSSDLAKIGFKDYLKGLCEELFRTYGADGGRIRLEIDAEAVALDIERAIPCGLIVNELLTNAIKYAFPGNRKGVLRVAIRNTPDSGVEIVVSDDGIGMPETLDIRKAQTLGLQLVTTLAENQLKGRVELERAGGTRFRIRFRI